MYKLPKYFEYLKETDGKSYLQPFSYLAEEKVFNVGNKKVDLTDFDPYLYSPKTLGLYDEGIGIDEMTAHPALIYIMNDLIVGPSLHSLANSSSQELEKNYRNNDGSF